MSGTESRSARRDPEKDRWVLKTLGINPASRGSKTGTAPKGDPRAIWREAKETTDAALSRLAQAMLAYEDPDLDRVAKFGLFGIGSKENVALNKALIEFNAVPPGRRAEMGKKLLATVEAYRTVLGGNLVGLIDSNPYGVATGLRSVLGSALDDIARIAA